MQRILVPVVALLLTAGLAWADDSAAPTAPPDEPLLAPAATAAASPDGGGCELPDLSGLSPEDQDAALRDAGFVVGTAEAAAVPICPTAFSCNSITNCAAGPLCAATDIGPCCATPAGIRCCTAGTIKVVRCPCQCTAPLCALSCVNSTDVKAHCS